MLLTFITALACSITAVCSFTEEQMQLKPMYFFLSFLLQHHHLICAPSCSHHYKENLLQYWKKKSWSSMPWYILVHKRVKGLRRGRHPVCNGQENSHRGTSSMWLSMSASQMKWWKHHNQAVNMPNRYEVNRVAGYVGVWQEGKF